MIPDLIICEIEHALEMWWRIHPHWVKIGERHKFDGSQTIFGHPRQGCIESLDKLGRDFAQREDSTPILGLAAALCEGQARTLQMWIQCHQLLNRGRTTLPHDAHELVDLVGASEEYFGSPHLRKYATEGPNVDLSVVVLVIEYCLR